MQSWSQAFGSNPLRLSHGSCSAFLSCSLMQQMICLAAWDLRFIRPSSIQVPLAEEEEIWWREMDGPLTSVARTHHRRPTRGCVPATGSTGEKNASNARAWASELRSKSHLFSRQRVCIRWCQPVAKGRDKGLDMSGSTSELFWTRRASKSNTVGRESC